MKAGSVDDFGREVRRLRKENDIGLRELARRADLSSTYISQLENGHIYSVSETAARRLARVLEQPEDQFVVWVGKTPFECVPQTLDEARAVAALLAELREVTDGD